ncbi:MAG: DUF1971 domain-containing protein [Gammaproteobacteria bacterium]|nr:DUF1971 domain-containing protein [Gammaproteobacteria bacterium]
MNYQNETLPIGAVKVSQTPSMTQHTILKGLLKNHLAPKDKHALVVVEEGTLRFVYEDDEESVLDADKDHPIVIFPERYHRVLVDGDVLFRVEFYNVETSPSYLSGARPGEQFVKKSIKNTGS